MRILVNDDWGGALCRAFRALDYDVQEVGVVKDILSYGWDLAIVSLPGNGDQGSFIRAVMAAPARCVAIVNLPATTVPGVVAYDQVVKPGMFGGGDLRTAGLWLKNLPPLENVGMRYHGLAQAMACQWGGEAFVGASLRMFANG